MLKAISYIPAYLCLLLAVTAISANAQNTSAPAQHTSEKSDGRFTAAIGTKDRKKLALANGLIDELEIEIQWWGLLGQPVEIYGVRWMPGPEYNLGEGKSLKRASLLKHPDLLARYDDLKPYNIEVSFSVEIFTYGATEGRASAAAQSGNTGGDYYVFGRALASKTTNNFLIGKSGTMMRDLSPSSPKDWQSFINWSNSGNEVRFIDVGVAKRPTVVDANTKAQNTFRAAKRIIFSDLKIVKIGMPDATARAILSEFELRSARESQEKDDDFWSDSTQIQKEVAVAKGDGFWGDEKVSEKKVAVAKGDGFWGDEKESEKKVAVAKGEDFWESGAATTNFEIKRSNDGKMGVSDANGNVLVPYRYWEVDSYESGIAKVTTRERVSKVRRPSGCNAAPGAVCLVIPTYDCKYKVSRFLVGKDGETLAVIENKFETSSSNCY